jgi:F0F1-type ATP synthase assembly protein I
VNKKSSTRIVFAHITIGLQLAITIFAFVYAGYRLDLYFNKSPLFLAVCTALGMGIGFYHLLKDIQGTVKKEDKDNEEKDIKRIKWN